MSSLERDRLVEALARLEHGRSQIREAKARVHDRAIQQQDSIPQVLDGWEERLQGGSAGGVMGLRRIETLHSERQRLQDVIERTRG